MQLSAFASGSVTLAWDASTDPLVVGYNIYYGGASGTYTNTISVGTATNVTIAGLVPGTTYYFAATTYNAANLESPFSSEVSYLVPQITGGSTNHPPTLNLIGNLSINENAGLQQVNLTGITSGATNENQTLTVTATSGNTGLIPNPTVNYTSANTTGNLTFTPVTNAVGVATVTVTVNDGGTSNNIVTRNFTVTVNAVSSTNASPTLDPIADVVVTTGGPVQQINLTGISSGVAGKPQGVRIKVTSSNPTLLSRLMVRDYDRKSTGLLTFRPGSSAGTANLTVTINNGARSNNIVSRTFKVTQVPAGASTIPASSIASAAPVPVTMKSLGYADGRYSLTVAGAPGYEPAVSGTSFVIEASTDLVNWVPVETNTVPFTFVDPSAGQYGRRFYRVVSFP